MTSPDSSPFPYEAPVSAELFARGRGVTPGGVNSPVRAFQAVGGTPRFMVEGAGPWLTDADGRRYVDLVSHGPEPCAMNRGVPPTTRNARTGLFTPPGVSFCPRAKRSAETGAS